MILVSNVKIPLDYNDEIIKKAIEKKINDKIIDYKIIKKSIDARRDVIFVMNFLVNVKNESKHKDLIIKKEEPIIIPKSSEKKVVIVGSGPAGLFAAITLIESGLKPIILERGKDITGREKDVSNLINNRVLDENSNLVYGLGGAGTYSDGKLNTNVNSNYNNYVLETFVKFGAPEEILYASKPHIGTDILKLVVSNMADYINKHGHIYYSHTFVDFNQHKVYAKANDSLVEFDADYLILALGHSPRDTFEVLNKKGIKMSQKPFSMGVRIEHTQKQINEIQYGKYASNPNLDPATYKMAVHLKERDVYTFCMCPGGEVVPSMNIKNTFVTNGMSNSKRDKTNANAALLVNVKTSDYNSDDVLAGFDFREEYERKAYSDGYRVKIARLEDFLNKKASTKIGTVEPSCKMGYVFENLDYSLPKFVSDSLRESISLFDKKMPGYNNPDAILSVVESRSSCPVRIERFDGLQTNFDWIYACGEGSGYAGGITTSAIDGMKIALAIISR